jgi:hypothetical protein
VITPKDKFRLYPPLLETCPVCGGSYTLSAWVWALFLPLLPLDVWLEQHTSALVSGALMIACLGGIILIKTQWIPLVPYAGWAGLYRRDAYVPWRNP